MTDSPPQSLLERIDALLPQTQCRRCLFDGCRPYAAAIAAGEADTDRCPPGGEATANALAALLGRAPRAVHPAYGEFRAGLVAVIDEDRCIGCAKCLPACPVDAIVGAKRYMHTVVAQQCTACELCLPPCPVDCISMQPVAAQSQAGAAPTPAANRARFERHE
ncbi:MAG: RnfABCDGE type electron transport complex subunit B, partial [Steroidobacteraceae bacterium]